MPSQRTRSFSVRSGRLTACGTARLCCEMEWSIKNVKMYSSAKGNDVLKATLAFLFYTLNLLIYIEMRAKLYITEHFASGPH